MDRNFLRNLSAEIPSQVYNAALSNYIMKTFCHKIITIFINGKTNLEQITTYLLVVWLKFKLSTCNLKVDQNLSSIPLV